MRDDFSAATIRILAARVGYHCSNPDCVRSTSGPALEEGGTVNIGVGAHIAAASEGGKRYDHGMSSAQRSSGGNGIWLCQSCSKLVDSDEQRYTVQVLHKWKAAAIQRAHEATACGRPLGPVVPPGDLDSADQEFLRGLGLPSADALDRVAGQLRDAARTDARRFREVQGGPSRTVPLTLRLEEGPQPSVTLDSLAHLVVLGEPLAIVAPGGTGKSTTLAQLAETMCAQDGPIPVIVPLGEWSDRQDSFFEFLLRRNAFGPFRLQHFMQLAYHGKLVLLLDGWNELTPEARLRATDDLTALRRDYPQLGIVVSSRRHALSINGRVIIVDVLSQDQQLELARAQRGHEGVEVVDRAWRTDGIRELVGIPLYLNALLSLPVGAAFPETKEAVLRAFVAHTESDPAKAERLQRDALGYHAAVLTALAVEANHSANTVIAESDANRTVSTTLRLLSEDGQIGQPPHPRGVIDGLVGAHLLVRFAGEEAAVRFQHQLFQEWYASREVERVMVATAKGDPDARRRLREEILNWASWEESILFACDRLSRAGEAGEQAVAGAIREALGIDPLLAASMLDRAAGAVWLSLRDLVLRFVGRWHAPGEVDRAARFMITSGKADFTDLVWPLASSEDRRVQFETFRAADRFRPGVFGADRQTRLRGLPTPQRAIALSELASNSGLDGMDLATEIASTEPDPMVVVAVVEALAFRRGDHHVNRIMKQAPEAVWRALGQKSYKCQLTDPELNERLTAACEAAREEETNAARVLHRIASDKPGDAERRITDLLSSADFGSGDLGWAHAISLAHAAYPVAVANGLVARLEADLPLPYYARQILMDASPRDVGRVAELALDPSTPDWRLRAAASVIGPQTVSALFDRLLEIDEQLNGTDRPAEDLSDRRLRVVKALSHTRQDYFVPALLERARTSDVGRIGLLADALARHGRPPGPTVPIGIDRADLREVLKSWMAALRAAAEPPRQIAAEVAGAVERLADAELAEPLREFLEWDLAAYADAQAARISTGRHGTVNDVIYTRAYARALAAMHDEPAVAVLLRGLNDLRWGIEAAAALHTIWLTDNTSPEEVDFGLRDRYSLHMPRRIERAERTPATSEFGEAIFSVVRMFGDPANTDDQKRYAIALAVAGSALPHGSKRQEIDGLLGLPLSILEKHRLLAAAAQAGEVLPAALLLEGLRELLAVAETQTWRLNQDYGEQVQWLALFPFSDDPNQVHAAIAMLPERLRSPLALRGLLETVNHGPEDAALGTLERLAQGDRAFFQDFQWIKALLDLDSEEAALAVLSHHCAGSFTVEDHHRRSAIWAKWARQSAVVRAALVERYRGLSPGPTRQTLEMAMDDLADEEVFMVLFEGQVGSPQAFGGLAQSIRNLAIGRKESDEIDGAFEEFSRPLTDLRARLFSMLPANDERSALAKECLVAIDDHRDEYGRVGDEPRHPDITTGRAWPIEAEEVPRGEPG